MAHQFPGESHVVKAKDQEDRHANVPVYEPERRRRLVEGFEDRDRSDGIDGSLLDSVVPDFRGSRIHGLVG